MGCSVSSSAPFKTLPQRGKDVKAVCDKRVIDNGVSGRNIIPSTNNSSEEVTKMNEEYKMTKEEVQNLREENNTLRKRLSGISAVWLTENNPNITDLTDENRPGKLLEQFSEIYDNEWTNGFEYLTRVERCSELSSIRHLLIILKDIYKECQKSTEKQRSKLQRAICGYIGVSDKKDDELVLKETERKLHEYRLKKPEQCLANISKVIGQRLLKSGYENNVYVALNKYIQGCIRVCWFMCVRTPQMQLYFGQDQKKGVDISFDDTRFTSYTRNGKYVKYFVWPAVFLYKDGPIMKKGVAQGKLNANIRKRKSKKKVSIRTDDNHNENNTQPTIKET